MDRNRLAFAPRAHERLPMKITWTDTEDIAIALLETYPEIDPLSVRFTDLYEWVTKLKDFDAGDDSGASKEKILEAIQMAWLEEKEDEED